jgi:tetratricopeptide (TPR) repeat protein
MKFAKRNSEARSSIQKQGDSGKKYPFYFYIITLLLPVFFVILLELLLRIFNYGQVVPQWVTPARELPGYLMLNPYIASRYFHNIKSIPTPAYEVFSREKKVNGFRVFVMGGSSAAGYPYPNTGAFSRYIKNYLELRYPDRDIEVINLAIPAVSTYTLRDLLQGVIDQKPDLVIFYTGHNEYYGALGAASAEFIGSCRPLVNFVIKLQAIRSVQLLQNIIGTIMRALAPAQRNRSETLMARMVGEQQIPLHSSVYELGLRQFAGNMSDMLTLLTKNNIPVLLGTLTCNLKDQAPFVSIASDTLPPAAAVFAAAQRSYDQGDYRTASNLFRRARDLDGLRFRAPGEFNTVLKELGARYNVAVVDLDSVFCQASINKITGADLILDHVHPSSAGQQLIGESFVKMIEQTHTIPAGSVPAISAGQAQQLAGKISTLTRLDSIFAALRIRFLKSGWPFKPDRMPQLSAQDFNPQDYIDELAFSMFIEEINWEVGHLKAALWYKEHGRIAEFEQEMTTLIDYLPLQESAYKILIDGVLEKKDIVSAYPYLKIMHQHQPGAYSAKWLGSYYLYLKDYQQAIPLLEFSAGLEARDAQLQYNLAGAYVSTGDYNKALQTIDECLAIQADFSGAAIMRRDLLRIIGTKK